MDTIGERIRAARLAKGWSQKELAERIEASQARISMLENDIDPPSRSLLMRLSSVLDVTTDLILFGPPQEDPNGGPGVAA